VRVWCALGWLGAALAMSACAPNGRNLTMTFIDRYAELNPTPAGFIECRGFNCAESARVALSKGAWHRVTAVFKPSPTDAQAERQRIARAVALLQLVVGAQTGTAVHQWTHKDMKIISNSGDSTQLDCIDEAVNTWTYMTLMERAGLFRFHRVAQLADAGWPIDPRNAAVLQEVGGDYFAVDPALVDAGVPPPIIPLATWMEQWPPSLAAIAANTPSGKKGQAPSQKLKAELGTAPPR
jgi:hypothetical protein